ncbi:hypothetical protein F5144DRAFT_596180 [Chaetomium tenue]|uniref:Uncharacterized protein n=1 Tax=Chaetomium tenue TaxID=1854479 RepID=A0ACB7NUP2_9PEZI|nr:hypothetical protein F5144DRAFT_596180 [Chaetomium globosum]
MDGGQAGLNFEERKLLPPSDEDDKSPAHARSEAPMGKHARWLARLSSEACGVALICGEVDEDRNGGPGLKTWLGVVAIGVVSMAMLDLEHVSRTPISSRKYGPCISTPFNQSQVTVRVLLCAETRCDEKLDEFGARRSF